MRSISRHISPLVINSLGCGHTHARIPTIRTGSILRNQARTSHRPARAWFNKGSGLSRIAHLCIYVIDYGIESFIVSYFVILQESVDTVLTHAYFDNCHFMLQIPKNEYFSETTLRLLNENCYTDL